MKVKIKQRPLNNFGPAECRCCPRLSWKDRKVDRTILKEAVNDTYYTLDNRILANNS